MRGVWALVAATVAGLIVVLELAIHLRLEPYESPGYFIAKFIAAFAIASFLDRRARAQPVKEALEGGLAFTVVMSLWYYVGFVLDDPQISTCVTNAPTYNCAISGVPNTVLATVFSYPLTLTTFFEFGVHFALFAVVYFVVTWWVEG